MLQTKRGREYAKAIPLDRCPSRLHLPEGTSIESTREGSQTCKQATEAAEAHYASMLEEAYREIVALRGEDVLDAITRNVRKIFCSRKGCSELVDRFCNVIAGHERTHQACAIRT